MESYKETVHIDNRQPDQRCPTVSNTKGYSHLPLGTERAENNSDDSDVEKTAPSNLPLLSYPPNNRGCSLTCIWRWVSVILVPVISISYLAFCYAVHYRVVPTSVTAFSPTASTQLFTNLGSVVTTINIIVISLALFPLKGLLNDLKSEEFFRLLAAQKNNRGVDVAAVNGISNSSHGLIEAITVTIGRQCSPYYVMALVGAGFVSAVSILAPAALSIQPVLIDGPIMAFSVGAISPLSLYRPVAAGETLLDSAFQPSPRFSAEITWAEREIGLSYAFSVSDDPQGVYSGFVVPTPNILNSTASARWLTDVIGLNPYCKWANPVNLTTTSLNVTMNSTEVPDTAASVHLKGLDLIVSVPRTYFPTYTTSAVTMINVHDPTLTVRNYTTGSLPTDGAMVMSVVQCASTSCTGKAIGIVARFVNFSNIPSMNFSSVGADYRLGFLVCKPNITVETREIRTQGSARLEVQPLATGASPFPRQGNLDWTQTSLLVAHSLSKLTTDSGPASSGWLGLGFQTQVNFLFGKDQMDSTPYGVDYENTSTVLKPRSTDQLTRGYTELAKVSMKPYVSGSLGTLYVPGRVASVEQIFVSSLPHVIASTVLIFLLHVTAIVAYFRRGKGDQFDLANVAAALADSQLPEVAKRAKVDVVSELGRPNGSRRWWSGSSVGQEVARRIGNLKVSLKSPSKTDGVETLHVSQ